MPGRFLAGIAALIWSPLEGKYLLLRRADDRDYAAGVWECITGRLEQGEGFEDALRREALEEAGVEVRPDFILGTAHFYRGEPLPENELVGIVYCCSLTTPHAVRIAGEHTLYRWVTAQEAQELLSADDPSTAWIRRVIARAEEVRALLPPALTARNRETGMELG